MNWKRTACWSWVILPFLLLALWPGVAAAQDGIRPDANAVLYELTENLRARGFLTGVRRSASSALMGSVSAVTAICPGSTPCALTAMATDSLSLKPGPNLGKGPVEGEFDVVMQGDNPIDGPELVVVRGTLSGKIDLSQAVLFAATNGAAGAPIGTISGRWSARGVKGGPLAGVNARGTFEGTFRLPFIADLSCLGDGDPSDCVPGYLGAAFTFVPAHFNELSLSVPTVRLELKFVETHNHHDDD